MQNPALTGSLAAVTTLLLATGFALYRRRADGRLRPVAATPVAAPPVAAPPAARDRDDRDGAPVEPELLAGLGVVPGTPATLLQFSSAFCAPCRATRRVLTQVAELLPGVRHVEVDAESRLAAVRALGIWRTPTVLVLDAEGRVVQRATGVPGKAQVVAAVAPLLTGVPNP
ncbi:TlpA family protein disulfide reductase [Plantactinospora sp. CA-290183]|uniref:TlpA family protein disulfide reductase n=1 Tax=Plantactinospora sp. CA-290183 TaxID=3240006 RepID=UPI003D92FC43